MGKMQRRKGAAGELEFAHLCQEHGYSAVHRTAQHCGKTGQAGDVEGLPGILTTFGIWFLAAFVVSTFLLAGIQRGTNWISGT